MKTKLKVLLLITLVCGLLGACGKDKKEEDPAATLQQNILTNPNYNGYNNAYFNNGATSWADFKAKVVAGQFAAIVGYTETYYYGACNTQESKFLGFIPVNSTSCSASFERSVLGGQILHELGTTEAAIKSQLTTIIQAASDNANSYKQLSPVAFQFISGNYIYTFNIGYPAAANPVSRTDITTGQNYFLMNVQSQSL